MELTTAAQMKSQAALLLNSRDAARMLAMSERALWDLMNRGEVRAIRVGRSVRYSPADLEAFVNARIESAAAAK
jgi:excisionase family DNA binding protein